MSIWEAFGMGRYKGFSREAGLLLDEAVELAGGFGCKKADTGHLLLAMLQIDHGAAGRFLAGKNITELAVRRQLAEERSGPAQHLDRHAMAPDLRRAMDYALIGAQNAHQSRAEPEHLLCAMLEDTDCAAGVLLASMGVQLTEAVRECRQLSGQFILPSQPRASAMPRGSRASDKYCRDLTRRAADGELDPVFCREKELDRMVEILCRRQKNNPCLVGEPGVGKTALAKALAASWFGSEKALLKFDMSEYQEQHTAARLLGAPPGYLGHDEGGQLTEAVRRRPYSVVLFDEIEKAHPDIQNILLQILEDGQLTDAMGRKADFRNTIVLLTSNLGARFLAGQSAPLGFAAGSEVLFEKQSAQAIEEAKKWFRPELVGRLDELIVFRPLADESLCAIAEKLLGQLEERAAHNGYQLTHTPRVGPALAARARSPYGARELRRQVDRAVEQALADQIAAGAAHTGQHWTADCTGDGSVVLEESETISTGAVSGNF